MPRFFFDTDDGKRWCRDKVGIDLTTLQDVPDEAMSLLSYLAQFHLPIGRCVMAVEVRCTSGNIIYSGTMTIVGKIFD